MSDEIYAWAEQAVEGVVLNTDPGLAGVWPSTTPKAIGWNRDDWLAASKDMIIAFNGLTPFSQISISEPARAAFHDRDLIDFVGAIADAAEQVA